MAQSLWKMDRRCVIMSKTHLPDDPATLLLRMHPKEMKTLFPDTNLYASDHNLFIRNSPKVGKNSRIYRQVNGISTQGNNSQQ